MTGLRLVFTIVEVVVAFILTLIVLVQSGKSSGLSGAIAGVGDTFLSKEKASTLDGKLAKATKWIAIVFVVLVIAVNIVAAKVG